MLREILEARKGYKVYFVKNELWLAYGQGSGSTTYLPNITRAISNKRGDDTYDSNTDKLVTWASENKPLKRNKDKNVFLFEIPVYPLTDMGKSFDIWGGDVKPIKNLYMIVNTSGIVVVNFFDKKAEAMAWMRSV